MSCDSPSTSIIGVTCLKFSGFSANNVNNFESANNDMPDHQRKKYAYAAAKRKQNPQDSDRINTINIFEPTRSWHNCNNKVLNTVECRVRTP